MKMKFSYDDFRENYLHSDALMPLSPLKPLEIIDMGKYDKALDDWGIERRIRKTFDELERRLGSKYFSEFERVQTKVKEYGSFMFPLYKILFLDIACEDWLSLVDFHKGFSRDHSVHQPLTAYIVCKLLGGGDIAESFQIQDASLLDKALDVIIDGQGTKYLRDRLAFYDSLFPCAPNEPAILNY